MSLPAAADAADAVSAPRMLSRARLNQLVDAVVAAIMTSTRVAQAKKFSLRGDGHPDVLCVLSLDNGQGYALLDKLNTTAIERVALMPMVSDRLVASGDLELDRACEHRTISYIDVHPCVSASTNVDVSKPDQVRATARANESIDGTAASSSSSSSSSGISTVTDSSATTVVPVRLQQIADAVYRAVMAIPKFQDKLTRFNLTVSHNGINGVNCVDIVTGDGCRYVVPDPEIRDHAECKTVNEIVTARLIADGFKLDHSSRSSSWTIVCPTDANGSFAIIEPKPMQSIEIVEPKPPHKKAITDHASFFRALCLTANQIRLVQLYLPIGAHTDDLFWLSCFRDDVLIRCDLSDVQIVAWQKLIDERGA